MNIVLWVFQILLALHTLIGAIWKFSNSAEATMPSLKAIGNSLWMAMGGFEIILSFCLVVPLIYKPLAFLAPTAALLIAAEMLLFTALNFYSGDTSRAPVIYWLVVAIICGFIAFGRFVMLPLQ